MNITVLDALQLPALKDAVLIAGEAGLHRVISSVNMMEVPDIIRFVKKGEFLVTTTYPIKDDVRAQERLIPNLVEKGVAALAIKPVFYRNEVPSIMVRQADELSFPLIQLPNNASFNEILNPILGEILNRQAIILRRSEEVHKAFTNLVLRGGSLSDIADMLSTLQDSPVSIHTAKMRLLAFGSPAHCDASRYGELAELCGNAGALSSSVAGRTGRVQLECVGHSFETVVHPIIVAGEDYGYLILWLRQGSSFEINVVEQAATVVALEIVKLRAIAEVERRFRSVFMEEIIQGKIGSRVDVLTRAETYGWDLSTSFVPVLIEIDDYLNFYTAQQATHEPAKTLRGLWNAVSISTSLLKQGAVVADIGARILMLVKTDPGTAPDPVVDVPLKLVQRIQAEMSSTKEITIAAGIGRRLDDIMQLKEGLYQAIQALEIGQLLSGPGSITRYDDLGAYRILTSSRGNPELTRFCHELLGELIKSDQLHNTELLRTLEVLLRCNFNLKEAAREMFIHYNTIRYRVARIEEIARVDLQSAEDRLNLQLAFRILKIPG